MLRGEILDTGLTHGEGEEIAYLIPAVGTKLDLERLMNEKISAVKRFSFG